MESFGRESTLRCNHAESDLAFAGVSSLAPGAHAVTRQKDRAVRTMSGRFMADKLFFPTMPDELMNPNTAEMKARLRDIAASRRDRIRWHVGKHTAEMAIAALQEPRRYRPSGKKRSRKRAKRLL